MMEQRTQFEGRLSALGDQSTESIARAGANAIYQMHLQKECLEQANA